LPDGQIAKIRAQWDILREECNGKELKPDELARVAESRTKFDAFLTAEKELYARRNLSVAFRELSCDPRFGVFSESDILKASYFRSLFEKEAVFNGQRPDASAIVGRLADMKFLQALPDVSGMGLEQPKMRRSRRMR
jgi:hypothetical protein